MTPCLTRCGLRARVFRLHRRVKVLPQFADLVAEHVKARHEFCFRSDVGFVVSHANRPSAASGRPQAASIGGGSRGTSGTVLQDWLESWRLSDRTGRPVNRDRGLSVSAARQAKIS